MQNIDIRLKPSRYFISLWICLWIVSFFITLTIPFSFWIKGMLFTSVGWYGWHVLHTALLQKRNSIYGLRQLIDGTWLLLLRQGELSATLSGESTVTSYCCILLFHVAGERFKRTCVIFKDAISISQYRHLRVALRCSETI